MGFQRLISECSACDLTASSDNEELSAHNLPDSDNESVNDAAVDVDDDESASCDRISEGGLDLSSADADSVHTVLLA